MTALRLIVDQLLSPIPGGIGRYAAELGRALIDTAPEDRGVVGVVSHVKPDALDPVSEQLPGLAGIDVLSRPYRVLAVSWQLGAVTAGDLPRGTSTHGTSLLTPLVAADRGRPVTTTIHDTVAWTHPETLTAFGAQWHRAMGRRAARHADAIVVPTRAVADELRELLPVGDRVHVIGGAPSSRLALPADADARAARMSLPEAYVLAVGTLEPRKGIDLLVRAMAAPQAPDVPLVLAGPRGWGDVRVDDLAAEAGLPANRLRVLGRIDDEDLAVVYARAGVFVMPSRAEGFGLPIVEAMRLGTPVVHSDVPALVEVAGGAGRVVPHGAEVVRRLAHELALVLGDRTVAAGMSAAGRARAESFSWRASAERLWRLHATL